MAWQDSWVAEGAISRQVAGWWGQGGCHVTRGVGNYCSKMGGGDDDDDDDDGEYT
jgi:hypothetical protein